MNSSYNYDKYIIEILYEDDHIAILNKPSGLLTHRKNSNDVSPNLQESIQLKFDIDDDEELKEGIVHRLDKDTSGIIIITKNKLIKSLLKEKFKIRELKKNYIAYTFGVPQHSNIEIDKNIARQKIHRTKFETSEMNGKNALTKISNIKNYFGSISKLDCEIITGRTHQIRVHLTSSGLPIIGDKNYIFNKEQKFRLNNIPIKVREYLSNFPRQALHSSKLEFIHPISEKLIIITCELPADMKDLESILK